MNVLRRSLMAAGLAAGLLTSVVSFAAKPKEIVLASSRQRPQAFRRRCLTLYLPIWRRPLAFL